MKNLKIRKICDTTIQYHIDRMQDLCNEGRIADAESIYSEIRDWIIQKENLEIISLEYINGYFTDI
jgi:hypothetical protein